MGKTIMIVEDEQAFHDLYTMMLEDTDYDIVRAYDGDEALAKLRLYIRLAAKMAWLSKGQYAHVVPMLSEIGKLLGGWLKVA